MILNFCLDQPNLSNIVKIICLCFFQFVKKGLVVKCEIHGVKKIERWISTHGGGKDDKTVLKSDFRHLIRSDSLDDYKERLSQIAIRWSQPFFTYFMMHISPEIEMFGIWTVQSWDFPTTEASIVTSNQCEHINRLAKGRSHILCFKGCCKTNLALNFLFCNISSS